MENIVQIAFIQNLSRALFCSKYSQIMLLSLLLLDVGYVVPRDVFCEVDGFSPNAQVSLLALPTKAKGIVFRSIIEYSSLMDFLAPRVYCYMRIF